MGIATEEEIRARPNIPHEMGCKCTPDELRALGVYESTLGLERDHPFQADFYPFQDVQHVFDEHGDEIGMIHWENSSLEVANLFHNKRVWNNAHLDRHMFRVIGKGYHYEQPGMPKALRQQRKLEGRS